MASKGKKPRDRQSEGANLTRTCSDFFFDPYPKVPERIPESTCYSTMYPDLEHDMHQRNCMSIMMRRPEDRGGGNGRRRQRFFRRRGAKRGDDDDTSDVRSNGSIPILISPSTSSMQPSALSVPSFTPSDDGRNLAPPPKSIWQQQQYPNARGDERKSKGIPQDPQSEKAQKLYRIIQSCYSEDSQENDSSGIETDDDETGSYSDDEGFAAFRRRSPLDFFVDGWLDNMDGNDLDSIASNTSETDFFYFKLKP